MSEIKERKFQRFQSFQGLQIEVNCSTNDGHWEKVLPIDISRQGISFTSTQNFSEGDQITIKIKSNLKDDQDESHDFNITAESRVIWIKSDASNKGHIHYGFHFDRMDLEDTRQLIAFTRMLYNSELGNNRSSKFQLFKKKIVRISPRYDLPVIIFLKDRFPSKSPAAPSKITGRLFDISLHGIRFGCNEDFAEGNELSFALEVVLNRANGKTESFKFNAKVAIRWKSQMNKTNPFNYLYGSEIVEVDQSNHKAHMQLIDEMENKIPN